MEHLPVVVVYGGAIWKLLLIAGAAAGPFFLLLAPARIRRGDRARARARIGEPIGLLGGADDGALVTVVGRLETEGCIERFEDGEPGAAASVDHGRGKVYDVDASGAARAEQLEIETGAGRVVLDGDVAIVAGSRGRLSAGDYMALSPAVRGRIADQCEAGAFFGVPTRRVVLRSLVAGDWVRARGVLRRVASDGREYRERAAWRLEPPEDGRIELAADPAGFGAIPLHFAARAIKRALFGTAATVGLLWFLGALLLKVGDDSESRPARVSLSSFQALSLAAATPFHREEALWKFWWRLRRATNLSPEIGAMHGAVVLLRDQCESAVIQLLEYRRFDDAARAATECKESGALIEAAFGMFRVSRFERASELFERGYEAAGRSHGLARRELNLGVSIHVSAGRWDLAAELARENSRVHDEAAGRTDDPDERERFTESARTWTCAAGEIERLAGNPEAVPKESALGEGCSLLRLGLRLGAQPRNPDYDVLVLDVSGVLNLRGPVWEAVGADPESASRKIAGQAAVVSALSGDDEAAETWIRTADSRGGDDWDGGLRRFEAVVALRLGDTARAAALLREPERLSHDLQVLRALATGAEGEPAPITRESNGVSAEAISVAVRGDVGPLAGELAASGLVHLPGYLPYLAKWAESGRDHLLQYYRWGRYDVCYEYCWLSNLLPFQATMRDAARALGDEERERFWQKAIERTLELLGDRRRAQLGMALQSP